MSGLRRLEAALGLPPMLEANPDPSGTYYTGGGWIVRADPALRGGDHSWSVKVTAPGGVDLGGFVYQHLANFRSWHVAAPTALAE